MSEISSESVLSEADLFMFVDLPPRSVGEVASGSLLTCSGDTPVSEAARMMHASHHGSILIVDDGHPVGIWTERDAMAVDLTREDAFDRPIAEVMTKGVRTIAASVSLTEAGVRFKKEKIRHLLVVDPDGRPLGMVSQTDVVLNHGAEHFLTFRHVRSIMSRRPPFLRADMPLATAARMIRDSASDAALVMSPEWEDAGIVTERDIVRLIAERLNGAIGDAASRPVVCVHPNATLLTARNLFAKHGIRHLAVRGDAGRFVGLLSFSDILDTLQYEYVEQINTALRRSRKDLYVARQVIEAALDAVLVTDKNGRIEYVNPAFTKLTGYTPAEVIGRNPRIMQSGRHGPEFYANMWQDLVDIGYWQGEIWNRRKDGEVFVEWLTINTIRGDDGSIAKYAAIFSDITEKKKTEELVWTQANYDALTGLPNRRLFYDRLEQEVKKAQRGRSLALLFIDLDRFKEVNDILGHDVGDLLLKEAASRIVHCVRESDTVARLGGDEFMVILSGLSDTNRVEAVAELIVRALEKPFRLGDEHAYLSASVGITLCPSDARDVETLVKNADQAMYVAKGLGRNCFSYFTASMQTAAQERLKLSNDLRRALEAGEFELYYQPIVELGTGRIRKAEALLRWHHPTRGTIEPAQFIPIAEETGLINSIGEWVFREAALMAKQWCDAQACGTSCRDGAEKAPDAHGCPVQISLNKSPRQFFTGNTNHTWVALLKEIGLPSRCIAIEITEGLLLEDRIDVAAKMIDFRNAGIEVTLDDFGTGYSAMSYLQKFDIDILKIDQSFVRDLATNRNDLAIAEAIIVMGHKLGLQVVAEGIETVEQRDLLAAAGCDFGQGFLFFRPLPTAEFVSRVVSPR